MSERSTSELRPAHILYTITIKILCFVLEYLGLHLWRYGTLMRVDVNSVDVLYLFLKNGVGVEWGGYLFNTFLFARYLHI